MKGKRVPGRVEYDDDDNLIEHYPRLSDVAGLVCSACGHEYRWHYSKNGWPGPYACVNPTGPCPCSHYGHEFRWENVAQAPNLGSEQMIGPGALTG